MNGKGMISKKSQIKTRSRLYIQYATFGVLKTQNVVISIQVHVWLISGMIYNKSIIHCLPLGRESGSVVQLGNFFIDCTFVLFEFLLCIYITFSVRTNFLKILIICYCVFSELIAIQRCSKRSNSSIFFFSHYNLISYPPFSANSNALSVFLNSFLGNSVCNKTSSFPSPQYSASCTSLI